MTRFKVAMINHRNQVSHFRAAKRSNVTAKEVLEMARAIVAKNSPIVRNLRALVRSE